MRNVVMIEPDRDSDAFMSSRSNNIATRLHTLKGAARDILDLARDPANREELIRSYGDMRQVMDDMNLAVETIWRPK